MSGGYYGYQSGYPMPCRQQNCPCRPTCRPNWCDNCNCGPIWYKCWPMGCADQQRDCYDPCWNKRRDPFSLMEEDSFYGYQSSFRQEEEEDEVEIPRPQRRVEGRERQRKVGSNHLFISLDDLRDQGVIDQDEDFDKIEATIDRDKRQITIKRP